MIAHRKTERVGFEPTVQSPTQLLSREPDSAALAPLQKSNYPEDPCEHLQVAEGVGFEPTVSCPTPVFKTGSINRSVTPPVSTR